MSHPCDGHGCDRCVVCEVFGLCCGSAQGQILKAALAVPTDSLDHVRNALSSDADAGQMSSIQSSILLDAVQRTLATPVHPAHATTATTTSTTASIEQAGRRDLQDLVAEPLVDPLKITVGDSSLVPPTIKEIEDAHFIERS